MRKDWKKSMVVLNYVLTKNVKGTKLPKSLHKKDGSKNHQNLPSVSPNFGPFSPKFDMPKTMQSHWETQ